MKKAIWMTLGVLAVLGIAGPAHSQQWQFWSSENPDPNIQRAFRSNNSTSNAPEGYRMTVELLTKQAVEVSAKLCQTGKYAEAEYLLQKVLQLNPQDRRVKQALAKVWMASTASAAPSPEEINRFLQRCEQVARQQQFASEQPANCGSSSGQCCGALLGGSAIGGVIGSTCGNTCCPTAKKTVGSSPCCAPSTTSAKACCATACCASKCSCCQECKAAGKCGCGKGCKCKTKCCCGSACKCSSGKSCKAACKCASGAKEAAGDVSVQVITIPAEVAHRCPVLSGRVKSAARAKHAATWVLKIAAPVRVQRVATPVSRYMVIAVPATAVAPPPPPVFPQPRVVGHPVVEIREALMPAPCPACRPVVELPRFHAHPPVFAIHHPLAAIHNGPARPHPMMHSVVEIRETPCCPPSHPAADFIFRRGRPGHRVVEVAPQQGNMAVVSEAREDEDGRHIVNERIVHLDSEVWKVLSRVTGSYEPTTIVIHTQGLRPEAPRGPFRNTSRDAIQRPEPEPCPAAYPHYAPPAPTPDPVTTGTQPR